MDFNALKNFNRRLQPSQQKTGTVISVGSQIAIVEVKGTGQIPVMISPSNPPTVGSQVTTYRQSINGPWVLGNDYSTPLLGEAASRPYQSGLFFPTVILSAAQPDYVINLPNWADRVRLEVTLRTDAAATNDALILRFNNDATAANYVSEAFLVRGAGLTAADQTALAGIYLYNAWPGGTAPAASYGTATIWLENLRRLDLYRSVKWTHWGPRNLVASAFFYGAGAGVWKNQTDPIASVTILSNTGANLVAGCSFVAYGYEEN